MELDTHVLFMPLKSIPKAGCSTCFGLEAYSPLQSLEWIPTFFCYQAISMKTTAKPFVSLPSYGTHRRLQPNAATTTIYQVCLVTFVTDLCVMDWKVAALLMVHVGFNIKSIHVLSVFLRTQI